MKWIRLYKVFQNLIQIKRDPLKRIRMMNIPCVLINAFLKKLKLKNDALRSLFLRKYS